MAYKWDSPQEWLLEKAGSLVRASDTAELFSIIQTLVQKLDGDSIQDEFQSEMDFDGYFEELQEWEQNTAFVSFVNSQDYTTEDVKQDSELYETLWKEFKNAIG